MLLILLAFLMKFVDISKTPTAPQQQQHQQRCACGDIACRNGSKCCWQHFQQHKAINSNSSSTSSGCDSNSSSKENYYVAARKQQQTQPQPLQQTLPQQQHHSITPQQLNELRYYQHIQQQQLQLLQRQLLQRRRLQQQLREQGVGVGNKKAATTAAALTCNQQYMLQQRLQSQQQNQQQHQLQHQNVANHNDVINNNFVAGAARGGFMKVPKSRRGMTEISTNNDINNKSHLSQPLQNSPHHFHAHQLHNSPQHFTNINKHLTHPLNQANHNNRNNQETLPRNSSANISNNGSSPVSAAGSTTTSAAHSPLHYRNPLNSPNNSPFPYAYYPSGGVGEQHGSGKPALTLQQHLRGHKSPLQQQLNELQQQLLGNKDFEDELSEESLKQNVAIVLKNLDRYNSALRSVILNEQVNSSSSVFLDDSLLVGSSTNNNFLLSGGSNMATAATPESDYNSNATTPGSRSNMPFDSNMLPSAQQQHLVGGVSGGGGVGGCLSNGGGGQNYALNCSLASSHDFTHDNSDYQWFVDYGYRDGCGGMQRSVLSSLSASYNGIGDLIYYEDLAKNLDANLAEVDMESFRAEDIHSLLSQLPSYCKSLGGGNSQLQQSLLMQQQMLPQHMQCAHNMSQISHSSANELIDNSICKSELLFSPVKESHISVDSLDMDAYPDDGDIILTCKANKDNYTIAFEGSAMYSDESFYEPNEIALRNKHNFINLHSNLDDIVKRKAMELSMSRSEQAFTARGKLQKSSTTQLQRYPSGNNNTADTITLTRQTSLSSVRRSSSLPNLYKQSAEALAYTEEPQLNVSQHISTSTLESCKARNLLPMCHMPISSNSTSASISERLSLQQQQQQLQWRQRHKHHHCCCSNSSASAVANNSHNFCGAASINLQQKHAHISGSASSGNSNPPAFNLVKLFIKQKSNNCSIEDQPSSHTCMDVSSGCWPSSDANGSSSSSSLEQRLRKKSMNDSGKGSALSRHDEEEACLEQLDEAAFVEHSTPKRHQRVRSDNVFYDEDPSSSSTSSLTATNAPAHRRRSVPLRNPQLCHLMTQPNNASTGSSEASRSNSDQLTQLYLSSAGSAASGANLQTKKSRRAEATRTCSTGSSSEMVTRSMQTSCGSLSTRSSQSDRFRCVPPSFLAKLNNLGEERQAPIYVIYPNYALPDLGFVQTNAATEVIFSPFNYKMAVGGGAGSGSGLSLKQRLSLSCSEDEILKTIDYKHVVDWQSLATLLPVEYRRRLKNIPEVKNIVEELDDKLAQRPLFCTTPPVRRSRPHVCDCAQYFQQPQTQAGEEGTSSSGSSQQPSSGYRGSSTLLTDSEADVGADPLKQLYIYRYEQQRLETTSPTVKTPPQPMPRGILRKTGSQTARNKRNSMIEEQQTKMSKLEKRRSLQEPPYSSNPEGASTEELYRVFEEQDELYAQNTQPRTERLSRKDLDARVRAENFLSSLPRNELKYYAEIAAILESESTDLQVQYDAAALKKEVSRALTQQKKVSFNDTEEQQEQAQTMPPLSEAQQQQRFSTPPNSPNISMAANGLRMQGGHTVPRRRLAQEKPTTLDEREQRKIESNRFKRLQIQWELMSKDSSMLKELANAQTTKSGGSTPTSAVANKSRIPRPVSYPAGKRTEKHKTDSKPAEKSTKKPPCIAPKTPRIISQDANGKNTRSPSRIVPPKRYSIATVPHTAAATSPSSTAATPTSARARTPTLSRTPATAPNTPKKRVQSPRTITRVR